MKQENINYLLVGLFTLGMLALLIVVLFRITGQDVDANLYYVRYDNIAGIKLGSSVTYGGYQIGQVNSIEPVRVEGKTQYRLELAIREDWKIPSDSVARIITPGVLADKQINIVEGSSNTFLASGDRMQGREEVSVMSVLNSVAYDIKDLSENSIKPFIETLKKHTDSIGTELSGKLPEMTSSINSLLRNLNERAEDVKKLLSKENRTRFNRALENFDGFSQNLLDLSSNFSEARDQLDQFLQGSNAMIKENRKDVRRSVVELRNALDAISQNIHTIVYNLESTSRNLNEFSRQLRENPGLLLGGSRAPKEKENLQGIAPP